MSTEIVGRNRFGFATSGSSRQTALSIFLILACPWQMPLPSLSSFKKPMSVARPSINMLPTFLSSVPCFAGRRLCSGSCPTLGVTQTAWSAPSSQMIDTVCSPARSWRPSFVPLPLALEKKCLVSHLLTSARTRFARVRPWPCTWQESPFLPSCSLGVGPQTLSFVTFVAKSFSSVLAWPLAWSAPLHKTSLPCLTLIPRTREPALIGPTSTRLHNPAHGKELRLPITFSSPSYRDSSYPSRLSLSQNDIGQGSQDTYIMVRSLGLSSWIDGVKKE
jgi:hypothetical protein